MGNPVVLKGATPIGFSNADVVGSHAVDIVIGPDGRISAIEATSPERHQGDVLDLDGCYVSPGWVDLHTHVFAGFGRLTLEPDLIGPATGVVMLVDVGSTGEAGFDLLRKHIIEPSSFPIKVFLNIGSIGTIGHPHISPIADWRGIDLFHTKECIEHNRDIISGIKVMACMNHLQGAGAHPLLVAKKLANEVHVPVMVHINEPPMYLEDVVDLLGRGDIITHCYTGQVGNSVSGDPTRVLRIYREAALKGILLDVGHGSASFSYSSARIAVENGVKPYTISTDLHKRSLPSHAKSLAWVMSKMLACGLTVEEAIADVTTNPAGIVGEPDWGLLEVGKVATLTVFQVESGKFDFSDTGVVSAFSSGGREYQIAFSGSKCFRPRYAIWGGNVLPCGDTG